MRKLLVLTIFVTILLAGCNFPSAQDGINAEEAEVATAVAQTITAESIQATQTSTAEPHDMEATDTSVPPTPTSAVTATLTVTPTEAPTETLTPTLTATPEDEDPLSWLGNASWTGDFNGGDDEGFYTADDDQTTIEVENNALTLTHHLNTVGWHTWSMNYRNIQDFYLEADVNVKECSGVDEYGLVFRGMDDYASGYFFAVRCNGEYSVRAYDGEYTNVVFWEYSDAINTGANQSNRLGIWAEGHTFRLYINGKLVKQFEDDQFPDSGHFGFLIAGYETAGFRVEIDRVRYWN